LKRRKVEATKAAGPAFREVKSKKAKGKSEEIRKGEEIRDSAALII
jgi:hypothetical protein